MLLGPPSMETGEPGALANNDCCDALEGVSPEGQEKETHDAASSKVNSAKRLIINASLLSSSI